MCVYLFILSTKLKALSELGKTARAKFLPPPPLPSREGAYSFTRAPQSLLLENMNTVFVISSMRKRISSISVLCRETLSNLKLHVL